MSGEEGGEEGGEGLPAAAGGVGREGRRPASSGSLKLSGKAGQKKAESGLRKERAGEGSQREEDDKTRRRLSEEDRLRLEEQASWSKEPDFFADMAPALPKATGPVLEPGQGLSSRASLQYQPWEAEEVGNMHIPSSYSYISRPTIHRKEMAGEAGMTSSTEYTHTQSFSKRFDEF